MQETVQEYTRRMLGHLKGKKTMDVLAATPKQVAKLITGVPRKRLTRKPAPDKWSVAEIVAHLADADVVQAFRLRLILGCNGTQIQGYDQNAWAKVGDYTHQDPALCVEAFRLNRERTVRLLRSIPQKLWNNYGVHSERGKETLKRLADLTAGHDLNHLEQIKRLLKP